MDNSLNDYIYSKIHFSLFAETTKKQTKQRITEAHKPQRLTWATHTEPYLNLQFIAHMKNIAFSLFYQT